MRAVLTTTVFILDVAVEEGTSPSKFIAQSHVSPAQTKATKTVAVKTRALAQAATYLQDIAPMDMALYSVHHHRSVRQDSTTILRRGNAIPAKMDHPTHTTLPRVVPVKMGY